MVEAGSPEEMARAVKAFLDATPKVERALGRLRVQALRNYGQGKRW